MLTSSLEDIFNTLYQSEIPALYVLFEWSFMGAGFIFFGMAIISLKDVRGIGAQTSAMQMREVTILYPLCCTISAIMLMNLGLSSALVGNSIYMNSNLQPYSEEVFRSINCSSGVVAGCLHYDLNLFKEASWSSVTMSPAFFNVAVSIITVSGAFCYGRGWMEFRRLGQLNPSGKPPQLKSIFIKILFGAVMMHPIEFIRLFYTP